MSIAQTTRTGHISRFARLAPNRAATRERTAIGSLVRDLGVQERLTDAEVAALSATIRDPAAEKEAREAAVRTLVRLNICLAIRIARSVLGPCDELADLVQDGVIGLHRAAEKFDGTRGVKFSTYASYWVRQTICRGRIGRAPYRPFRVPNFMYDLRRKALKLREEAARGGEQISLEEAATRMGEGKHAPYLKRMESQARQQINPGAAELWDDGSNDPPGDVAVGCDPAEAMIRREDLATAQRELCRLDERSRAIVRLHLGLDPMPGGFNPTLKNIGMIYGLCRERIRQIIEAALARLRGEE